MAASKWPWKLLQLSRGSCPESCQLNHPVWDAISRGRFPVQRVSGSCQAPGLDGISAAPRSIKPGTPLRSGLVSLLSPPYDRLEGLRIVSWMFPFPGALFLIFPPSAPNDQCTTLLLACRVSLEVFEDSYGHCLLNRRHLTWAKSACVKTLETFVYAHYNQPQAICCDGIPIFTVLPSLDPHRPQTWLCSRLLHPVGRCLGWPSRKSDALIIAISPMMPRPGRA